MPVQFLLPFWSLGMGQVDLSREVQIVGLGEMLRGVWRVHA
jgi:hypothetical protein